MSEHPLFRDTIYALSSGGLPSGVAIIRLSGPQVRDALTTIVGRVPPARLAALSDFSNDRGEAIDRGLVLFFPAPHSFTGEDCAEFHVHGGRAVVAAMLGLLGGLDGLRQAEAGEFTRRAFLNGKIDLTGAEALADLVAAETEVQRRLALENAQGRQHDLYMGWRARLVHARAMIEAELDFADEPDVPGSVSAQVEADIVALGREIRAHVADFSIAEIVRDGFRVVLIGAPNSGKSSLLNALAQREVAIVTDIAGTTRDLVEVSLDLQGVKVIVTDTAGIRDTTDVVERIGVQRALDAAGRADLVVELIDLTQPVGATLGSGEVLRIGTKRDLVDKGGNDLAHRISTMTGEGLGELVTDVATRARRATSAAGRVVPTRRRQVELLKLTAAEIGKALGLEELELKAEHLRQASEALGRITGAVDTEELLGVIFAEFCIGK